MGSQVRKNRKLRIVKKSVKSNVAMRETAHRNSQVLNGMRCHVAVLNAFNCNLLLLL
jgi:hypothetical protein